MRRSSRLHALLLGTVVAAACQAETIPVNGLGLSMPVTSIQEARTKSTVLQKYDFSCGSAAIATLLTHHYNHPVSEQEVLEAMYAKGDQPKIQREGFSLLDMKRYLAGLGYAADGFKQPLEKLAEAKLPAIVLINENNYHHFVVVKGVNGDRVLVGDPARGTRSVSRKEFEASWIGGLLFVVHNHVDRARFNLASDWRAAPRAPLFTGVQRNGMPGLDLPKNGPGDF